MPAFDFLSGARHAGEKRIEELPIAGIRRNPNQPRETFSEDSIAELAQSIAQVGLIQPIIVQRLSDGYELVAGERRLRAVSSLGRPTIACIVQEPVTDEASAMMALIENLQREDLYFLEEARCYRALIETYGLTQEQLAERLGRSQSSVANKLRLLRLSPEVAEAVQTAGLSERHARAILKLKEPEYQLDMVRRVQEKGLSVKDTESLVEKKLNKLYDDKTDGAAPRPMIVRLIKDYRLFMNTINTAVNQLRDADMVVEVDQSDIPDGVDIHITVHGKQQ